MSEKWDDHVYKVAILTGPPMVFLGHSFYFVIGFFKRLKYALFVCLRGGGHGKYYGGHSAVTGSLYRGLKRIGVDTAINPLCINKYDCLVVMCSKESLDGWIKYTRKQLKAGSEDLTLIAGPNITVNPKDAKTQLTDNAVKYVLVPSRWVQQGYVSQVPMLKEKIRVWYAGVDPESWSLGSDDIVNSDRYAILYLKSRAKDSLFMEAMEVLERHQYIPILIEYGSYSLNEWKDALGKASFAIFVTLSESQGIALLEAWAMNVPTFILECGALTINGNVYKEANAAPYLSDQTGGFWENSADLDVLVEEFQQERRSYHPQNWLIANMSDEHSAFKFIEIYKEALR